MSKTTITNYSVEDELAKKGIVSFDSDSGATHDQVLKSKQCIEEMAELARRAVEDFYFNPAE